MRQSRGSGGRSVPPPDANSVVETTVRVRYAETDQMGGVYYANYLVWFEVARGALCRERGIDYPQMERDGFMLPVLEAHCRYLHPAYFDDDLTVRAWVVECRHSLLKMQYMILRGEEILATGETLQMLIERATGKPRRFTAELAARFAPRPETPLSPPNV